ncbi:MAG: rhodanese-like domain-containing protein [Thermodesulfobacteriota bacterium]
MNRVGADELMAMLDGPAAVSLIDVRTPDEFRSGHIPGSVSVPMGMLAGLDALPLKGTIVLCCASGMRSGRARNILAGMGVEAVDLKGGVKAWVRAGGALTIGG